MCMENSQSITRERCVTPKLRSCDGFLLDDFVNTGFVCTMLHQRFGGKPLTVSHKKIFFGDLFRISLQIIIYAQTADAQNGKVGNVELEKEQLNLSADTPSNIKLKSLSNVKEAKE
uniref:Uncharacterized protein n=1 Tax=Glossina austeni TaxID=7395 RepID=A0A1A9UDW3_GLOAU